MSTTTPNPRGLLYRTRLNVQVEYDRAWLDAQVEEDMAIAAARATFRAKTAAITAKRDDEFPMVCVTCNGSDRIECDGCPLFSGGDDA